MIREVCEGYDEYRQPYFNYISQFLVNNYHPKKVLDIGCGGGGLVKSFKNQNVEAFGVEGSKIALHNCIKDVEKQLLNIDLDTQSLPFGDESFDLLTCCEVIEHLENPNKLLLEMRRVLKKGEIAYITTPTPPFFGENFYFFCGIKPDPSHINVHSCSFWVKEFQKIGFTLVGNLKKEMNEFRINCPSRKTGKLDSLANKMGIDRKTIISLRSNFSGYFLFKKI